MDWGTFYASSAEFYKAYPQHARGRRTYFDKTWPLGSDERALVDEDGREWMITLIAQNPVFEGGTRYRTKPGQERGAVVGRCVNDGIGVAGTYMLVEDVDLYDAYRLVYQEPKPGLEKFVAELTAAASRQTPWSLECGEGQGLARPATPGDRHR